MPHSMTLREDHALSQVQAHRPSGDRRRLGRLVVLAASLGLAAIFILQVLDTLGVVTLGLTNWRPVLYGYLIWSVIFGAAQVMMHREEGEKALFVLPAVLFTIAMVICPTLFGLAIAFTDWNLSSGEGPNFNGLGNIWQLMSDRYFWNALLNMVFYVLAVLVQYALALGLALLLNAEIRARKFFRIAFLLPLMLRPCSITSQSRGDDPL